MDVKVIEKDKEISVGGFSVVLNSESETADADILWSDSYKSKMERLNNFAKNKKEYYGLLWYLTLHEDHKYLVGQEIIEGITEFEIKIIPRGIYAYAKFPQKYNRIQAWTEFYSEGIPKTNHKPVEKNDIAFEYYPNGLNSEYELWSLVEKA
jgi:hypothetical protein